VRKRWFVVALVVNIAFLFSFKYINFLLSGLAVFTGPMTNLPTWEFPVGISFYTLTQVMNLVDCYERLVPPKSLFDHATFVSFFPCVTAGPLLRAKLFMRQLPTLGAREGRHERWARSLVILGIGLVKKVVFADAFAQIANAGYSHVATLTSAGAWLTSLAFTFQLYFDFSGYSDIAFGAAGLLGVTIVRNFNAPYRAVTISEFWQRWHMSLSSFITTYLYTPILRAMGRITIHKAAAATLLAMAIAGLWHGPAWTFVLFGVAHGIALALNQYWKRTKRHLPRAAAALLTFVFVNFAFILFRSPDVPTAFHISGLLLPGGGGVDLAALRSSLHLVRLVPVTATAGVMIALIGPTSNDIAETWSMTPITAFATASMVFLSLLLMNAGNSAGFVYQGF
jgi:D-alanyl-lipoteichoic acid acyltransferase DltB (MBOAT superfamily)